MARAGGIALLMALLGAGPAAADPWPIGKRCPRGEISAREYNRCLYDAVHLSDKVLDAALEAALAVIEARADLAPVQRGRWRTQLQEAHSRFLLFRNFDCQSVAPYEGGKSIGNFEHRALCLIVTNERRAQDLRLRYAQPAVPPAPAAPPVTDIGTRPATWLSGMTPRVD